MASKELPVDDHMKLLLEGEAHAENCEISPNEEFKLPPWFDEEKYKRGQKYIRDNIFGQFTCTLAGLVSVLSVPSILTILVKTHRSTTTDSAFKRYLSTIFHVWSWYMEDLTPGTNAWKSLHAVRTRHFKASKTSKLKGDGHISQRDMVFTQFAFLAGGLLEPEKLGMNCDSQADQEAYVHFWRTIGYMLGISDKYNLCRPSLSETKKVFEVVRREVYCHYLVHPPEYFFHMVFAVLRGMWYFNPTIVAPSFYYYTMWIFNVKGYDYDSQNKKKYCITFLANASKEDAVVQAANNNLTKDGRSEVQAHEKELGWLSRMMLHFLYATKNWYKTYYGRLYLNGQIRLSIFLLKKFPFLSFWHFGFRGAYVDMFTEDAVEIAQPKTNVEVLASID